MSEEYGGPRRAEGPHTPQAVEARHSYAPSEKLPTGTEEILKYLMAKYPDPLSDRDKLLYYIEATGLLGQECARQNEANEKLRAALEAAKRTHSTCEDCWYSCPKSGECCNEHADEDYCTCGADEHNAAIESALKETA